jgi:hypothetical protein
MNLMVFILYHIIKIDLITIWKSFKTKAIGWYNKA